MTNKSVLYFVKMSKMREGAVDLKSFKTTETEVLYRV